jgi:hypothetical protein
MVSNMVSANMVSGIGNLIFSLSLTVSTVSNKQINNA